MKSNTYTRWDNVRRVWEIIDRLRGEGGCPWDRKQTPQSVQTYLIEEAHEAAAAVQAGSAEEVADELGDVLFMVLFLVHLYEERNEFRLEEVCDRACDKMIRRHPHVFADVIVHSSQEVKDNWERIKAKEKASADQPAGEIPRSLPGLMRAYRMLSRLSHQDKSAWNDVDIQRRSLATHARELGRCLEENKPFSTELLGDILIALVNLGRLQGYRAEDCLHQRLRSLEAP